MTSESNGDVPGDVGVGSTNGPGRWLLLVGTPLLLAGALGFHPEGGGDLYSSLTPIADTWLALHVLLLALFGLFGVCLYVLLDGYAGRVATIGRIGVAVYLVFYVAFEAIAGVATGLLVRGAQSLPPEQQAGVAAALETTVEPALALGLVGTVGAIVTIGTLATLYRRAGAPLGPIVLLAGAPLAMFAHGGTNVDALGMVLFALGVVWLERGWRGSTNRDRHPQPE